VARIQNNGSTTVARKQVWPKTYFC